ncbi:MULTISPECIES: nuclear transport factor 2 family protein [unclassified Pseudoalteromonas]|uniref:nuclear transport factor 2 family protein n=1 Tax=unclassified Pseudoalteromonas TaxID=194690 RepID=UPI0025B56E52|nr:MULTISPECIES: nuclear transport factor 2 family protein [unclassified Pseudoalteromonas]MDN3380576.1 nuclear transport factor 2 family protein [Pseudoalteromonas sp. APC 3893]MDN3388876.1 nuclear transport factor 2 family protein [Pseudoalteromonas sp. APC 4017]
MKSLLFAVSLLLSWQLVSAEAGQNKEAEKKQQSKQTQTTSAALQDSVAVITLTPEKAEQSEPTDIEPTQPIVVDPDKDNMIEVVDTSKVLGNEAAKPAELPKTQQEKAQAVAQADQAVAQAKQALTLKQQAKAKQSRESLAVIEQLIKAYNARNIEAFVKMYDENVEFYAFPNELLFKGKEKLIARYGIMFKKLKCIKSSPIKRIVYGNIVIDHELSETCSTDKRVVDKRAEFVSSYEIENGKITKVLFFR